MELDVSFTHLMKDEPPGYRPPTFAADLRAAGDLYSTGQVDLLLDAKTNDVDFQAAVAAINAELAIKAPINSPVFTGAPQAPTPATASNDAQIATTAFTLAKINSIYTAADVLTKLLTVDGVGSDLDADKLGGINHASYALLSSPAFTGAPTAPTTSTADVSLKIANTQLVSDKITLAFAVNFTPIEILNKLKTVDGAGSGLDTDFFRGMQPSDFVVPTDLTIYAPLASPAFSGTPTAPTPSAAENSTRIATTAFVQTTYAKIASPAFTGTPTAPTAAGGTNTTQIATTAFVQAATTTLLGSSNTWTANNAFTGGINLGSGVAASATDLTRHIRLYGNDYGFSVTNGGHLNYIGQTDHVWYLGGVDHMRLTTSGLTLANPLAVAQGGTGQTTITGIRTALGLAAIATSGSAADLIAGVMLDARLPSNMTSKGIGTTPGGSFNASTPGIAFGDNDTGIRQAGDGILQVLANNVVRAAFSTGMTVFSNDMVIQADGNKHLWFRTAAGINRAIVYNDASDNSVRFNIYNSSGTFVRALQFRESDGRLLIDGNIDTGLGTIRGGDFTASRGDGTGVIFLGGGSRYLYYDGSKYVLPTANLQVGSATLQTDGNIVFAGGMTGHGVDLYNALNNKVTVNTGDAGSARYLKNGGTAGGTNMQFNWNGQGGQPQWIWGGDAGSTGTQMYVYNPSNFSVNYANSAGNANTVGGIGAGSFAQFHQGTGTGDTNMPIGSIVQAYHNGPPSNNTAYAVYLIAAQAWGYTLGVSAGTQLSGTWRARGVINYSGGNYVCVMQRTG